MKMIGSADAIQALVAVIENKQNSELLRIGAIEGLSYSCANAYRDLFFNIMGDSESTAALRGAAAKALGRAIAS